MAISLGQKWQLEWDGDVIGEITSVSKSPAPNLIELNSFSVGGQTRYIKGRTDTTATIECLYDPGNTAQAALIQRAELDIKTTKQLIIEPADGNNSPNYFLASAFVSGAEITYEDDEPVTVSFEFQASDMVAYPAIPALALQVDTNITGATSNSEFLLAGAEGEYSLNIYESGKIVQTQESLSGEQTISFASAGIYDVRIIPKGATPFHRIALGTSADNAKVIKLKEWGPAKFSFMSNAFAGCSNMEVVASDTPDIGDVTSMADAFNGVTAFNEDLSGWDFSSVTDFDNMLADTAYNGPVQWLNNGNAKTVVGLFKGTPLAQDISVIDISDIKAMDNAFDNTPLTEAQYDKAVIKWANDIFEGSLTVPALNVGALNLKYSDSVYWDDFYEKEYVKTVEARYYLEQSHSWTFVDDTADLLIDVHGAHINVLFSGNLHNTALIGQDFVEVERASDGATQIFQATVRGFDKNAIEAFCAGSQGFIRWIDNQAGNAAYDSTFGVSDDKPFITDSAGILLPDNEIRTNNASWQIGASHVINEQDTGKLLLGKFANGDFGSPSIRRPAGSALWASRNEITPGGHIQFNFSDGSNTDTINTLGVSEYPYQYYNDRTRNLLMYAQQEQDVILESNDFGRSTQTMSGVTVPTDRNVDDFVTSEDSTIDLFIRFDTTDALAANLYEDVLAKSRVIVLEEDAISPVTVVPDTATDGTRLANTGLTYDEANDRIIVSQFPSAYFEFRVFNKDDFTLLETIDASGALTGSQSIFKIGDNYYNFEGHAYNAQGRNASADLDLSGLPAYPSGAGEKGQHLLDYSMGYLWMISVNGLEKIDPSNMQIVKNWPNYSAFEGLYVARNFIATGTDIEKVGIHDRATGALLIQMITPENEGLAMDATESLYVNRDQFFHGNDAFPDGIPGGNRCFKYNSRKIGF